METNDRALGMHRDISRGDFLNGVAVTGAAATVGGPLVEALGIPAQTIAPEQAPDYYPPLRTGLRGSHPGSFEVAHENEILTEAL